MIVTDNLFGDILTDLAAAIAGGIGLAASGNLDVSRHQPVDVRAGARLGARHRRPGHRRPDRGGAVGRDAARAPRRAPTAAARVEAAVAADLADPRPASARAAPPRSASGSPRPQRADVEARHDDPRDDAGSDLSAGPAPGTAAAGRPGRRRGRPGRSCGCGRTASPRAAIATAAAALAWTDGCTVGIGLLPVPLRNVALTAMEIATLERLSPAGVMPGVGHGVLDWMAQVGARVESPMTLLREYTTALRALLHGQTVDVAGRYVQLTDVALAVGTRAAASAAGRAPCGSARSCSPGSWGTASSSPARRVPRRCRPRCRTWMSAEAALAHPGEADVVVFAPVPGERTAAAEVAAQVGRLAAAGATHVILHAVGDGVALEQFAEMIARDVRPLVP